MFSGVSECNSVIFIKSSTLYAAVFYIIGMHVTVSHAEVRAIGALCQNSNN